ncbi:hypothetical protein L208DRAFT_1382401 [Tricholoma matsutake]|nr:hypothetical protein L208DRAFT_1382401 [Tricholoma matsutake 945]
MDADGICHGYLLDMSDNELGDRKWKILEHDAPLENVKASTLHPTSSTNLDIPACDVQNKAQEAQSQILKKGLLDIEKLIASKQMEFDAGQNGLQAYHAQSIQSCLKMSGICCEVGQKDGEAMGCKLDQIL